VRIQLLRFAHVFEPIWARSIGILYTAQKWVAVMHKEQPDYLSYLLRLWRGSDEEEAVWRASLESPVTGERQGFANLADLFSFL
jgi:hypothetical protein